MTKPFIAMDEPGKTGLAIGNAAIARGAFEAGVIMGSGYPGTPSTEILENFTTIAVQNPELPIQIEWSINEKVGFEVAYGGSLCNARSLATMKHVGVNVASDSLMTAAYSGARGGMVLITADDPSMHSSQNEQDNRYYGMQALIPTFEPSDIQESKDMMKYAFEFSEKFETIVLYRTTTRINHARGDLTLGTIEKLDRTYDFDVSQKERWTNYPVNARRNYQNLKDRIDHITEFANEFPFNNMTINQNASVGIIASGIPYAHTLDILELLQLNDQISLFKLGLVFPLPRKNLITFLKSHKEIIVVEELEPIFEQYLKNLAYEENIPVKIHGKDLFPQTFEFYPELIAEKFAQYFKVENPIHQIETHLFPQAPPRPPVLCAGCGHRNIYSTVKRVERRKRVRFIHSSDIGCYTLGYYEPLNGIDACIAMGASIGMANGISKLDERVVYAFLGDSTFFHSGIAGLINAVYNQNDIIIVIMDNGSTSMTGHQDHPGTGIKIDKQPGQKIDYRTLIEGLGVPSANIWIPDANNLEEMEYAFEKAIDTKGVRVIIPTTLCALLKVNQAKKSKTPIQKYKVHVEMCCEKEYCLRTIGCPSMSLQEGHIHIDTNACAGCSFCTQICPYYAIKPIESEKVN